MIDKYTAIEIAEELKAAATEIYTRYGLTAPKIKTTYGSILRISLESTKLERGEGGVNLQSEEAQYYTRFGFNTLSGEKLTAPLGTRFSSSGKDYVFAGIAARRRKFPIYCLHATTLEPILFTESAVSKINAAAMTESAGA